MSMWFYEYRRLGMWHPVKAADEPVTASVAGKLRLKSVNGLGVEVRAVREIPRSLEHLTLDQLAEVFGADGKLQATG